jgi:hypothetical protein
MTPFTLDSEDYAFFIKGISKYYNNNYGHPEYTQDWIYKGIFELIKNVDDNYPHFIDVKNAIDSNQLELLPNITISKPEHLQKFPLLSAKNAHQEIYEYFNQKGIDLFTPCKEAMTVFDNTQKYLHKPVFNYYLFGLKSNYVKCDSVDTLHFMFDNIVEAKKFKGNTYQKELFSIILALFHNNENHDIVLTKLNNYYISKFNDASDKSPEFKTVLNYIQEQKIDLTKYALLNRELLFKDQFFIETHNVSLNLKFDCEQIYSGNKVMQQQLADALTSIGNYYEKDHKNKLLSFISVQSNHPRFYEYNVMFDNEELKQAWTKEFNLFLSYGQNVNKFKLEDHIDTIILENKLQENLSNNKTVVKKMKI